MGFKLLVFDLDGTLIDSRLDLVHSVNATLAHLGRAALPDATIASYIGDGAGMLIRRALDEGDSLHRSGDAEHPDEHRALAFFLDFYHVHKLDHTTLYPGVLDALTALRTRQPELAMAVLTNKPARPSREICAHFGLHRFFFQNYGGDSFPSKKPDPVGLKTLIAEASAALVRPIGPSETLMIGDSDVDILTARNTGAHSLACSYGLAPHTLAAAQPDASVDTATNWPDAIAALAQAL